jgi:hypothetical protein
MNRKATLKDIVRELMAQRPDHRAWVRYLRPRAVSEGTPNRHQYPFGQNVLPQQFVKRDRTQAGLAQGVVMIQSDLKGGSLHASRATLSYDRWLAVPYPTPRDRELSEPKIQANLLIADGDDYSRADFLRCPIQSLRKVLILHNKNDYLKLVEPADHFVQSMSLEVEEEKGLV